MAESWRAQAPSNIALIKYMGKKPDEFNRPLNASLSWTLPHLVSTVEITQARNGISWQPLGDARFSAAAQNKFLAHFAFLKDHWRIAGEFCIASGNEFPSDCGLASSASSFAALTLATYKLALSQGLPQLEQNELAALSRRGSGSSCRSFFPHFALWQGETVEPLEIAGVDLHHRVVIVSQAVKKVSSSEAHRRVLTSALFAGRAFRAEMRLEQLIQALRAGVWSDAFDLCWAEFCDMHALFETSAPPFGYITDGTVRVLRAVREQFALSGDGPLVTLDAGPNVHCLFRSREQMQRYKPLLLKAGGPDAIIL
jgi:diphosphomevalonate decarboxylase